jgi:CheY-like chemotaxis protein
MTSLVCPALAGVRALVVDDDEDGRDLVATVLAKSDAIVTTAATAAEALGAFERERPRVVVSDIGLPGEDGFSLIRKLRAFSTKGERLVAVALSGYGSDVEGQRSREAGFDAHLTKPVALDVLLQTLTDLLARPT